MKIAGGCLCGRVRYASDASPAMIAACHCTHCQKQSGSAFSMNVGVPAAALKVEGDSLATYHDTGSSGLPVLRHFCRDCGSPIYSEVKAIPGLVFVKAGTLDDASWVQPAVQIWGASKQPWSQLPASLPEMPGNPPAG
jgi:hypothetical protein